MHLADFSPAPNQGGDPALYEIENRALDPDGLVLDAMRRSAPWAGRTLVDLGCGSGFWLPVYADEAAHVIGVEPDERLLPLARARGLRGGAESETGDRAGAEAGTGAEGGAGADADADATAGPASRIEVLHGSAEHIPLPDASADVVHARFAYFFPPDCEPGLAEVMRVLRPGGALVVVDNDLDSGQFAELLRASSAAEAQGGGRMTDDWWAARSAERAEVMSEWRFERRSDFESVLRLEFPAAVANAWLAAHPDALGLNYGYVLFTTRR